MLSFVLTDTEGRDHLMRRPLSVTIHMDEDVPADDCYAVFAYEDTGESARIDVYDNNQLMFAGVADEQEHILSSKGRFLRISARSLAAHLLDNEAMPQSYDHPSASLIFERHIRPYGIRWTDEDDATYFGEQQIIKGMSQWAVLKNFCNACFSTNPRVTSDGKLRMKGIGDTGTIVFSDTGDGIAYSELSENKKRCEEISRVNIKVSETAGYDYLLDNSDAVARGVVRERYLNAVLSSTPMTSADAILSNSAAASYSLTLRCPGQLTGCMGQRAVVRNKLLGMHDDLYISGVSYHLDSDGESTTLKLKRRKN